MCEYCGCQDVAVIAELTAEHDHLRGLSRELEAAALSGDLPRARSIAATMRAVLRLHNAVEETGLFPAMAGDFPQVAALIGEHRSIDGTLSELADGEPSPHWGARTRAALVELFEHILKEQDGVFPAALATLSPDDWDTVADVRRKVGAEPANTG